MKRETKYQINVLYQQLEEAEERLMLSEDAAGRWQAGQDFDNILAAIADLKESVFT